MRLTTQRYYTPSGRSIQAKGIEPDIEVQPARVEVLTQGRQRTEASLPGALANPDEASSSKPESGAAGTSEGTTPQPDSKDSGTPPEGGSTPSKGQEAAPAINSEAAPQDYQLERAIDLLRGIAYYQASLGSN